MSSQRVSFEEFVPELVRSWPEGGTNLAILRRTASTNELARRLVREALADASEQEGVIVCAFEQTAGRGRRGNAWSSPAGSGVYATLIVAVEASVPLASLPIAVGVALAEGLNRFLPEAMPCRLKWPNDLVVAGGKIGGVLIETTGDGPTFALIGFGINVTSRAEELPAGATSLALSMPAAPSAATVLRQLASRLQARLRCLREGEDLAAEYAALSLHRPGDRIQFRQGEERVAGTFLGFGPHGTLRLEIDGAERHFSAGEVIEA